MASSLTNVVFLHIFLWVAALCKEVVIENKHIATLDQDYFKDNKDASVVKIGFSTVEHVNPNFLCAHPNLKVIHIYRNEKFPKVTSDFFKCTPNVENAEIVDTEMEPDSLSELRKLEHVEINNQHLGKVKKNFLNSKELKSLRFFPIDVQSMDGDVFANIPNLESLDLAPNLPLKASMFQGLNHLQLLELVNTENGIPWDSFGVLPSVQKIHLTLVRYEDQKDIADQVPKHFPNVKTISMVPPAEPPHKE